MKTMQPQTLYKQLLSHYGEPDWWPADTPYEVIVGAVLTQNTAWTNVEAALRNLEEALCPERIAAMDYASLEKRIRPAGFFRQKARYLKAVTEWYSLHSYRPDFVKKQPLVEVRKELLRVHGVGPETADSILLYAFGFPTFVVDAYTVRLCERLPLEVGSSYASVKAFFETALPADADLFNRLHALIVIHGKEHCRKRPVCDGCPLSTDCRRIGC